MEEIMSWDHEIKTIKCPCGNGTIEKEVRSDDWGRYEESKPYINCPNCSKKYRLITVTSTSVCFWKGGNAYHYLVGKDVDLSVEREQKYPKIDEYELCKKDFSHYLIVAYKLDWLLEAKRELSEKTNVSSLKGFANGIAKCKKKYYGGAKIKDLRKDVEVAIKEHDSYMVNKEKLEEHDEIDRVSREKWLKKVEQYGMPLDI